MHSHGISQAPRAFVWERFSMIRPVPVGKYASSTYDGARSSQLRSPGMVYKGQLHRAHTRVRNATTQRASREINISFWSSSSENLDPSSSTFEPGPNKQTQEWRATANTPASKPHHRHRARAATSTTRLPGPQRRATLAPRRTTIKVVMMSSSSTCPKAVHPP